MRYQQFALSLNQPSTKAESEAEKTEDAKGASNKHDAAAEAPPPMVVVWSVENRPADLSNGLLPIFLGGLFICVFGMWFSHISLSAATDGTGLGEKLLAPLLSLALVGIGATQQIETAKIEKDAALAERGLPAVVNVSSTERRERLNSIQKTREVRVLPQGALSVDSAAFLEGKIAVLEKALRERDTWPLEDKLKIAAELERLRIELRNPDIRKIQASLSDGDLELMRKTVAELDEATKVSLAQTEAADKRSCRLLDLSRSELTPTTTELLKTANAKDDALKAFQKRHWLGRIVRKAPEGGAHERQEVVRLQRAAQAAADSYAALCDTAPTKVELATSTSLDQP